MSDRGRINPRGKPAGVDRHPGKLGIYEFRCVWHSNPWGRGMGGIRLTVLSDEGQWRIKVGERLSQPFRSQSEAIRIAFDRARALGRDGRESEGVLNVLTCQFGPNDYFRTIPTPRRPQRTPD